MKAIGIRVKRISCYAINDVENSEKLFAECVGRCFNVNHSHFYLFKIPFNQPISVNGQSSNT